MLRIHGLPGDRGEAGRTGRVRVPSATAWCGTSDHLHRGHRAALRAVINPRANPGGRVRRRLRDGWSPENGLRAASESSNPSLLEETRSGNVQRVDHDAHSRGRRITSVMVSPLNPAREGVRSARPHQGLPGAILAGRPESRPARSSLPSSEPTTYGPSRTLISRPPSFASLCPASCSSGHSPWPDEGCS